MGCSGVPNVHGTGVASAQSLLRAVSAAPSDISDFHPRPEPNGDRHFFLVGQQHLLSTLQRRHVYAVLAKGKMGVDKWRFWPLERQQERFFVLYYWCGNVLSHLCAL